MRDTRGPEARVIRDEDKSTGVLTTWNCPKIQQLKDGRILLLCDTYLFPPGEWGEGEANCHIVLWFSDDDGESWSDPIPTPVKGICPDIVTEMDDGRWLLPSKRHQSENWTEYPKYHNKPRQGTDMGCSTDHLRQSRLRARRSHHRGLSQWRIGRLSTRRFGASVTKD